MTAAMQQQDVIASAPDTCVDDSRCGYDWVTPQLAVGGCLEADDGIARLRRAGISAVVDVRVEATDDGALLARHGVALLRLPTRDCCALSLRALSHGVAWVDQHLAAGRRVYIHCQHGIGRSALLAACVLVRHGATPLDALIALKRVRPRVSPSPPQLRTLLRWARRTHGGTQPRQSLADLGRIAWTSG
jgi:protein-tyrosine phosphatase